MPAPTTQTSVCKSSERGGYSTACRDCFQQLSLNPSTLLEDIGRTGRTKGLAGTANAREDTLPEACFFDIDLVISDNPASMSCQLQTYRSKMHVQDLLMPDIRYTQSPRLRQQGPMHSVLPSCCLATNLEMHMIHMYARHFCYKT